MMKLRALGILALGMATFGTLSAFAQDNQENKIEIVNQDGEKVTSAKIQIEGNQAGVKAGAGGAGGGVSVQRNQDGKFVITDGDGNQRVIDVEGAKSIIINQSVESVTKNGQNETKRVGKAIIVGPDGTRHEIELGGPMDNVLNLDGFQGTLKADRVNNKFMIGVHCEPVTEALQAQLQLDSGVGLLVAKINNDSPAQAAGIQRHDILMFADDRQLQTVSDLTEVVQTAGKEKNKVSLTIMRAGKEIGIDVAPVERPESEMVAGVPGLWRAFSGDDQPGVKMQFRQLGPGAIFAGDLNEDFHKEMEAQMEEMQRQVEELRKQMEEQFGAGRIK